MEPWLVFLVILADLCGLTLALDLIWSIEAPLDRRRHGWHACREVTDSLPQGAPWMSATRSRLDVPTHPRVEQHVDPDASRRNASHTTPRRYLVVANLTVCGDELTTKIQRCIRAGSSLFYVVVPASADPHGMTWTEEDVLRAARARLGHALSVLHALGAHVSGEVGDWTPILAIADALRTQEFDEIILSTPSPGLSRWIRLDLPHRVANRFGLPVSRVISPIDYSADGRDAAAA